MNNGANGGIREAEGQEDGAQAAREPAPVPGEVEQPEAADEHDQQDDNPAAAAPDNGANNAGGQGTY